MVTELCLKLLDSINNYLRLPFASQPVFAGIVSKGTTFMADLVIDASGQRSQTVQRLRAHGIALKSAHTKPQPLINLAYATRLYKVRKQPLTVRDDMRGGLLASKSPSRCTWHAILHRNYCCKPHMCFATLQNGALHQMVVTVSTPPLNRNGYIQPVENGYIQLNLSGYNQTSVPKSDGEIAAYAKSLPTDDVFNVLQNADPVGSVEPFQRSRNVRIAYDEVCLRLAAYGDRAAPHTFVESSAMFDERQLVQMCLPDGLCIIGDAACAFNPVYGQGMTMAAQGALALHCLLEERISTKFNVASQRISLQGLNKVS